MPYEFGRYEAAAEQMYAALWETTPHVLGVSCDEAYLECSALLEDDGGGDGDGGGGDGDGDGGGDDGGGGGDDDGGDDDRSGPVARVMFVGLVGWAGVLAVLVPAVWYACCPPRGSAPKPPPPSGAPFLAVPAEEEGEDKAAASERP